MEKTDLLIQDPVVSMTHGIDTSDKQIYNRLSKLSKQGDDIADRYRRRLWNVCDLFDTNRNSIKSAVQAEKPVDRNTISKLGSALGVSSTVRNFGWCNFTESANQQFIVFGPSMYTAASNPSFYVSNEDQDSFARSDSHAVKDLNYETGEDLVENATITQKAYYAETGKGIAFIFANKEHVGAFREHIKKYFPSSKIICDQEKFSNFVNVRQQTQTLGIDLYQLKLTNDFSKDDLDFYEEWYWFLNISDKTTRFLRTKEYENNPHVKDRYNKISSRAKELDLEYKQILGNSDVNKMEWTIDSESFHKSLTSGLHEIQQTIKNIASSPTNSVVKLLIKNPVSEVEGLTTSLVNKLNIDDKKLIKHGTKFKIWEILELTNEENQFLRRVLQLRSIFTQTHNYSRSNLLADQLIKRN